MSTDDYEEHPEQSVVADLARRAAATDPVDRDAVDSTLLIQRRRDDETIDVVDLEAYEPAPRRARGSVTVHDPVDFARYVQRVGTTATTVWADQQTNTVTAVINDHQDRGDQGWRDHRVVLSVLGDPEWDAWTKRDKTLTSPVSLAEHLEEYGPNVVDPDAASMLEMAQSIRATRTAAIEDTRDLRTGAIRFAYRETIDARAGDRDQIEIPAEFTIGVAPYLGYDPVHLRARLRFQVGDKGGLSIGYQLIRPDLVKRAAFAGVRATLADQLGSEYPVLLGTPPEPRRRDPL